MGQVENYRDIARAITALFSSGVEVVLHDLDRNRIDFISGNFGGREAGESSYLSEQDRAHGRGVLGPYRKVGKGGDRQRSISVVLDGDRRFMLCINFKTQCLEEAVSLLSAHLGASVEDGTMTEHFSENWQDQINAFVENYLRKKAVSLRQLSREEKRELVLTLKHEGAFEGKNAAQYIADSLKISRATVYGYLK